MKFEKITDDKIKIIYSSDDMKLNSISLDLFFNDDSILQNTINYILSKARDEIDFKANDNELIVEALKGSDGSIIFTITKLQSNCTTKTSNCFVFKFDCFDDLLDFSDCIKNVDLGEFNYKSSEFSLIFYNNTYYFTVKNKHFPLPLYYMLIEFAKNIPYSATLDGILNEYGNVINLDSIKK